jgi:hypothetical protein
VNLAHVGDIDLLVSDLIFLIELGLSQIVRVPRRTYPLELNWLPPIFDIRFTT